MLTVHKQTGLPFAEGLNSVMDLPHTFTYVINYRAKLDNLAEFPKDKRPPRGLLDKPYQLEDFIDEVFSTGKEKETETDYIEFDLKEAE